MILCGFSFCALSVEDQEGGKGEPQFTLTLFVHIILRDGDGNNFLELTLRFRESEINNYKIHGASCPNVTILR